MADQFAAFVVAHRETGFRQLIFPKLAGVVKKNSGNEQIEIQLRIQRRDRTREPHHLRGVLNETAPAGMMIIPRRGRAAKTLAPFLQKQFA